MKKTFAVIVSLLVICLAAVSGFAAAEKVRLVEDSPTFDIEMELPEGSKIDERYDDKLFSLVKVKKDGMAPVIVTISPSEIYDETESFDTMKEEEIKNIADITIANDPGSDYTIETSDEGNPYIFIHTHTGEDSHYDSILLLYHGYCIFLAQMHEDFSKLNDNDTAFLLQMLKNIHFIELQKADK